MLTNTVEILTLSVTLAVIFTPAFSGKLVPAIGVTLVTFGIITSPTEKVTVSDKFTFWCLLVSLAIILRV